LTVQEHIDDDFVLMLGDNVFQANLSDVIERQRRHDADAAFLVETVPYEEASRYGICVTNDRGEIVEVMEKPEEPPSNLVMTGFYTFSPAIFHACHLVRPSDRGEFELPDAIDLLVRSGRRIDAVVLDGWRIDVGFPEDREEAERRLGLLREHGVAGLAGTSGSERVADGRDRDPDLKLDVDPGVDHDAEQALNRSDE
jgi:glucose-1-phosphate thymidylyltransferase